MIPLKQITWNKNSIFQNTLILSKKNLSKNSLLLSLSSSMFQKPHPKQILRPPQNKSQTPSTNPADILKKNDILMYSTKPTNYIESVTKNGFHLSNNLLIESKLNKIPQIGTLNATTTTSASKNDSAIGLMLLQSEAFEIKLNSNTINIIDDWYVDFKINTSSSSSSNDGDGDSIIKIFELIHPKPEILIVGLGKKSRMLSIENKNFFSNLGIQLEITNSNNGAKIFDLLATERPNVIGAILLPPNI
ncbi:hypothetical protein MGE_02079 [Candida albicans P75010]|uniref:NADH dehydrogenase [ubiquinone] 1 alpha subcomplex assembly factor 3 n=1 Tax=Candida albicans (strain SC5314 / ATCC MYA-2876) TaxID=237561 RepID=A0A1D8PHR7_CANAL|nr:uncharacterized protein CAALFM_C206750CA [Candida albicans SC5314]AOW27676.1 hypothetical protein CAALFM_C206750CA [Candida albicans SC5314]KHC65773.1 hypothetical protein MGE_02079 [Candida albicans P75010]|eukprot:XP_710372.1 hypothetical protein CAALFM_C206750CA [Candida albicans SC5314]